MYKQHNNFMGISHESLLKAVYTIIFSLSAFVIFFGVSGIIEHKSPENLGSITALGSGFFVYFKYHALILFGALCFTISMWFMRKK